MKKYIISGVIVTIAIIAGINMNINSQYDVSDISRYNFNVEALSQSLITEKAYVNCSGTDVSCTGSGNFNCCL